MGVNLFGALGAMIRVMGRSGGLVCAVAFVAVGCGARSDLLFGSGAARGDGGLTPFHDGSLADGVAPPSEAGLDGTTLVPDAGPHACAPVCSTDGWCWSNPLPQGSFIAALWGTSAIDVWAVGAETVLHWDGAGWCPSIVGDDVAFTGVWGTSRSDVWAAGYTGAGDGEVLHFDGTAWSTSMSSPGVPLSGVSGTGPSDVWAVGEATPSVSSPVFHWDGSTWSGVTLPAALQGMSFVPVWASGPGDVWIGSSGTSPTAPILHWDGQSWTAVDLGGPSSCTAFWGSSATDLWALTTTGGNVDTSIFHWDGHSWTGVYNAELTLTSIGGTGPNDAWALGDSATAFGPAVQALLHWDGAAWSPASLAGLPAGTPSLWGLWDDPSGDLWAAGTSGTLAVQRAGAWSLTTEGTFSALAGVWASGPTDAWAVGATPMPMSQGAALHWDGTSWASVALPAEAGLLGLTAVWGSGPNDVWTVGYAASSGMLGHWDGSAWTFTVAPMAVTLTAIEGSGTDDVWAVGAGPNGATILHWDGSAWTVSQTFSGDGGNELRSVWANGPTDAWAVGGEGTLLHWDGTTWNVLAAPSNDNLEAVWASGPSDVWVLDENGNLWMGDANGWTTMTVPTAVGGGDLALWGSSASDVWVVAGGPNSSDVLAHWDGATFTLEVADTSMIGAVGGSGPGDTWLVGQAGEILHHQ